LVGKYGLPTCMKQNEAIAKMENEKTRRVWF
jgi:hypothetical protein